MLPRIDWILKYADLSGKGIEIAPYFNPAVAKRDGHDVLIMDMLNTEKLRSRALDDPRIPDTRIEEIENVDLVGDASRLGEVIAKAGLQGKIDYIVSSHNFEHLPNPILFLQGAYDALAPGGVLSMAVPDCRAIFDHFRLPSRLSDWLAAYHEDRRQPSPETLFDGGAHKSMFIHDGQAQPGCDLKTGDPAAFEPNRRLVQVYEDYKARKAQPSEYRDAHCNVFFPETLELMLRDLRKLNLVGFDILEISETQGLEFFVHLRKPETPREIPDEAFYAHRHDLLVKMSRNLGAAPYGIAPWDIRKRKIARWLKSLRSRVKNRLKEIKSG
ncbi:class I SAM-dependent methyltransferase [Roseovarius sp. PS-C2]|uniref:methyltransferase domain-containing protein n=1 Tax=Roseovarius sp. PS-C2 TaxID=2820814 RepID=UPI001C0CB688|nr:methyltransferase domain-containing protein [Roseovarius sp. PS-C2]MBU3259199.1 class I SAM-dependent methyltransferase [Roseovarius sp. PS-C2]